jgi:glycosyltransferase involved in cell wall biosynthesis
VSRIGIVYPRANLDTVPSLIGAAEAFAEAGYDVDLFTYSQAGQPAPHFGSSRIRLRSLGTQGLAEISTASLRGVVKRAAWLPGAARAPLVRGYQALGAGLARGSRIAARARSVVAEPAEPYTCVIGVDPDGLALAHTLARGVPIGYYSLELLLSYEVSTAADRQLKAEECELSRRAAFVVVQDEGRGRLLADDNNLAWDRVALVPNAPPGPARRQPSRYWHDRFADLPAEARVVVHSGSLGDWTGIDSIVESAADWPEPWVLVVHTRYDAESSAYVDALRRSADSRRVRFSVKPVPRQDYDALIDGADVGLAFYVPVGGSSFTQSNVQTIGLSSGKLAYYLRAGLPVIVNRAASIASLVESGGCGIAVDNASSIAPALDRIARGHAGFSSAACAFFEQHLDFRRAFGDVVRRVDALRGGA